MTRNADILTYPVANVHATKNTCYFEASTYDNTSLNRRAFGVTALTNNRSVFHYTLKYGGYGTGATTVNTSAATYTLGTFIKGIMRWENGNPGSAFVNSTKLTDTGSNVSVTPTIVDIGCSTTDSLYGNIKNVRIWPNTLLTDAQCIQLTS